MTTLGAILAGGASSRMGQDKADVLVGDDTMLEMVGRALSETCDQVVLLGPIRDRWECWPDTVSGEGPLVGITTALTRSDHNHVAVVAVDHPFVRPATLRQLIASAGELPFVPVDDHGVRQVTCAVYPVTVADAAREEAMSGGSIQSLLDRVAFDPVPPDTWAQWGEDGRSWFSVDSPDALDEARSLYG